MQISYNWLKNYISTNVEPESLVNLLTDCGLEVEGFSKVETVKGGLKGLIVGEVLTKEKHPDADKLSITTVDIGNEKVLNIVCGAPNVAVGNKVVVAIVGTTLYDGEKPIKIKKSKIRGAISEGMICAEDEIGIGNSHDGIMILPDTVEVGTLAKDYFSVETDYVYEIGLTPNRSDATGHIGVARDVVTVLNLNNKNVSLLKPPVDNFKIDNKSLPISVKVEDFELCPRYSGLTLSGIKVDDSPSWLKNRLLSIGLTPINNVVDVTNFVLHETGQPLHAFDVDKILGNSVVVKTLPKDTPFKTLDNQERKLSSSDLMICNSNEGMCIAGVFGGEKSGVNTNTVNIFLESAYFNPVSIRKTAKRHGLNTDASFRYERGADPNITIYALKRAALLIKEVAGGEVSSDIVDIYPNKINDFEVDFNYSTCDKIIGEKIDRNLIKEILFNLEINIVEENNDSLKLSIPPFKTDVQREIDVVEEILRIYGFNNIDTPSKLNSAIVYRSKPDREKIINKLADTLIALGFNEILNNSLSKKEYYPEGENNLVEMINPLSNELAIMRQSLLFTGLENIVYNQNRQNPDLKFFEFGSVYSKVESKFKETKQLGLFITGKNNSEGWNVQNNDVSFYELKGYVEALMKKLGIDKFPLLTKEADSNYFAYGLAYTVNKMPLVSFGKVANHIIKKADINNEVCFAEFDLNNLIKLVSMVKVRYTEPSKFPSVKRDLALLIDKHKTYAQIEQIAYKQEKKLLKRVNLFDVYEGEKLPNNKKSYGVSFTFQDTKATLNDKQVDKVMDKLIASFKSKIGAEIR